MSSPIDVVEAAYRADLSEEDWLRGVVDAAAPSLDGGYGVVAFTWVGDGPANARIDALVGRGVPLVGWERLFRFYGDRVAPHDRTRALSGPPCATLSETVGSGFLEENRFARYVRLVGIHDLLSLHGRDLQGLGCVVSAPVGERGPATDAVRRRWASVAAHVAAGLRLRRSLEAATDDVILDAHGRVVHAVGAGLDAEARVAVRAAAVAVDRARAGLRRRDPDEALGLWRALVDGRWTIVDHFDRDGRRFVVAKRNDPSPPRSIEGLTRRELQVLGYAALGHSNKYIAYELGLEPSTIASHLSQAAKKLGADSRAELVRRFHAAADGERS